MKSSGNFLKILKAEYMGGYVLKLFFSEGCERTIDFSSFLENSSHPEIKKYLSIKRFKSYKLENDDLMWGDFDLIFPINDLYAGKIGKTIHRTPEVKAKSKAKSKGKSKAKSRAS